MVAVEDLLGGKSAMKFDLEDLQKRGFAGFVTLRELRSNVQRVPDAHGVYAVLRLSQSEPAFLEESPAGWFKQQDPSRPVAQLRAKWVPDTPVVYFGKAGPSPRRTLRRRIGEFLEFGAGEPIGHRGGRATWQLADASDLLLGWKRVSGSSPRDFERQLLEEFESHFGALPFANFQR